MPTEAAAAPRVKQKIEMQERATRVHHDGKSFPDPRHQGVAMRGFGIQLSKAIRNGAGATLLSVTLIAMSGEATAEAEPGTLPGELVGSWITEEKGNYAEFESDSTYVYKEGEYTEVGDFEVQGKEIRYTPKEALEKEKEQPLPDPYTETWSMERPDDGIDKLTTKGEDVSLTYVEMTISQCL
ncbi:hypothetical protein ACFY96_19900 [Streptomyces massasporeus]